ncbi:hypothetical protein LV164_002350 [Aspergillus fumigatus]|nr:hypothetical protein LV164_002350 [Aspergillus fumigatus]
MLIIKKDSEDWQPAVFALGEDGILSLIITVGREPTKINFTKASGLFSEDVKVQAFAVLQAPDSSLDICIATEASDTTSNFYLLHHITLDEIPGTMPSAKVIQGVFPTVRHIFMGHKSGDSQQALPLVMVAFKRPDRLTSTEDLNYVKFVDKQATLVKSWSLPVNPKKIYNIALITCPLGDGVMVLYEGFTGGMFLVFKVLDGGEDDDGDDFAVQVPCPKGATCLASFLDPAKKWTVVLVGGEVITALTYKEYRSPHGGPGAVIDELKKISDLKDLHLSQTGEKPPSLVHHSGRRGGRISSLLSSRPADGDRKLLVSSLLSVDEHGNLSLLQQDPISQAWQQYPFWHASVETVTPVTGIMVRLHATVVNDGDGDSADLLPGCWLRVSCSGVVRCIINGRHTTLSPTADWHQTDAKGALNILLQTDDATIHKFAVDAYRPAQAPSKPMATAGERNLMDPVLDPSQKVLPKIEGVQTPADVQNLKKPDGSPLFAKQLEPEDAKGAAAAFQQLVASAKDLNNKDKDRAQAYHATVFASENPSDSPDILVPFGFWSDVGDAFNGMWHWLGEVADTVWHWTCDLVDGVWKFIVHIGEEIYEIALTTITSIVKGVMWVLKKIGAVIKDIIEFISYLFDWTDILATTDSVAAGFNAALDYGEELLTGADLDVHKWLENIRTTIQQNLTDLQSNDYEQARVGTEKKASHQDAAATNDGGDNTDQGDDDEIKAGVTYNWSTYCFLYGGGPTNAVLHDETSLVAADSTEDQLVKLWDDVQSEVKIIMRTLTDVAKDLVEFFNPASFSVQDVVNKLESDLINGMIDALEKLADILFDALKLGIGMIRDLATKEVDIPVITWLWKNVIARGRPLTLLNFCALLIAIPTTVLYKAKKKCAPPKLHGRLTKSTFAQYVQGQADASLASDMLGFSRAAGSSVVLVGGEFDMLSLGVDGAFEGLGLEIIPIGPIDSLMNVLDSASLTFETVGGFSTWPVGETPAAVSGVTTTALSTRDAIKYAGWVLAGADLLAGAVVKIVGKKKKLERPVIKRWKGTVSAVMSVPTLCLSLTGNIMDASQGSKKDVLIVDGFIETAASFGATWGKSVARWNDEFENELMYIGLAVYQFCTLLNYGLKIADFAIEKLD